MMHQKKLENRSGTIERNGFNIPYSVEGTGPVIVIIGSVLYYQRLFSLNLRNHFQLVFIDHCGFVKGPEIDPMVVTMDLLLEDIEFICKKLELKKFIILGHSGHGYMALEFAKKYHEYVTKIILVGMGPDQSPVSHQAAEQYLEESACPDRKAVLKDNLVKLSDELKISSDKRFITFCLRLGARSWYDFNFDASYLWKDVYVNMPIIDRIWGQIFAEIDITQELNQLEIPTLLILGKFDYLVAPFYTWYSIRSKFKKITIRLFEKSSHAPQFEEPDLFDQEVIDWVDTI